MSSSLFTTQVVGKRAFVLDHKGQVSGRPTVNLILSGIKVTALVDTGASCTLLRRDIFDLIVRRTHRACLLEHSGPLQGLGGVSLKVCGKTQVAISGIISPVEVVVCDELPHEMILGDPSLRKGRSVIDLTRNVFTWFSQKWPLRCHLQDGYTSIGPIAPETGSSEINNLIQRNSDCFSAKGERNGNCSTGALRIKTHGPPICQKAYRMPLSKRKVVEEMIKEMLDDDIICPSNSAYSSPILLVPKKDGESRLCVDYRKLNEVTQKDAYPLPHIQEIFDLVGGSTIYSTLDLKAGYYQMPVAEEDKHKTAFRCHLGHYAFNKVPFGLKSAPNFFQREMNKILADLIGKCVFVYIDDILVYSKTEHDHIKHLQLVFDKLRDAGLKLKPTKCAFGLPEVKLLGYVLNADGITTDPDKVDVIAKLKPPTTVKEVRSMLGMCNYYRNSLPNYATVAEPLIALTRQNVRFSWDDDKQAAFDELKRLLTSSHVMAAPDMNRPYRLYTDACDYAIGGILVQESDDGVEKVIQYVSHTLSNTQRKWATIEKEAYAVVFCIEKLRAYLFGSQFHVYTDHKPLLSLFTKALNNTKIQRWGILLAEFGATISYRSGRHNIRADMLSRIKHTANNNVAVIDTEDIFDPELMTNDDDITDILPLLHDGLDLKAVAQDQRREFPELWQLAKADDDYEILNCVLYSLKSPNLHAPLYPRLVLPTDYREAVISRAHQECGHLSVWKTVRRITEAYVWKGLRKDVRAQLRNCAVCLTNNRHFQSHAMGDMPIASYPIQIIGADLIGPLVESPTGNRYILTIIDFCTGWAEAFPLPNKTNESVWNAFANGFICRHGVPEVIITDNAKEFTAFEFERYLSQIGIEHRTTTPVHPQSNGKIERFNKSIKELIQKAVNNVPSRWESVLNDALLAYRASVSTTTGYTPYFLMTGRHIRMPLQKALRISNDQTFGNRLDELARALKIARAMTEDSRKHNRERLARKANARQISPGDSVIIKSEARVTLTSRWDPHWTVTRVRGPVISLHHQQTGKTKVLNAEKCRIVNPEQNWDSCNPRPIRHQVPSTTRRRLAAHTDSNDRPMNFDTGPNQIRDGPSVTPGQVTRKRLKRRKRQRSLSSSDGYDPPREDRQPNPRLTRRSTDRSLRPRTRSVTAREAADRFDSDSESLSTTKYFRKRRNLAPPTETEIKRHKCAAIALCVYFTH